MRPAYDCLLQRGKITDHLLGVVTDAVTTVLTDFSRVRSLPYAVRLLLDPGTTQKARQPVVALVTARLGVNPILLIRLPVERVLDRPWPRPCRGVLHRGHVFDGVRAGPCIALHDMHIAARPHEVHLEGEVGDIDDERIAFPAPA